MDMILRAQHKCQWMTCHCDCQATGSCLSAWIGSRKYIRSSFQNYTIFKPNRPGKEGMLSQKQPEEFSAQLVTIHRSVGWVAQYKGQGYAVSPRLAWNYEAQVLLMSQTTNYGGTAGAYHAWLLLCPFFPRKISQFIHLRSLWLSKSHKDSGESHRNKQTNIHTR